MNESEKQFFFTRAALSTGGRPKTNFLPLTAGFRFSRFVAQWPAAAKFYR